MGATKLERRSESITQREPDDAADDAVPGGLGEGVFHGDIFAGQLVSSGGITKGTSSRSAPVALGDVFTVRGKNRPVRPDQREHPAGPRDSETMDKIGPKHRTCRRVGEPLCGRPNCPSNKRPYPPGQHGRGRKRISEYQTRLVEKQKLRAIYGVSESQMRRYYDEATASKGVTGEELIRRLETRLDSVVLRLGFALTTRQARQLVSHGHVLLDGKRVNVPSARVKPEQVIEVSGKAKNFVSVREAVEITAEPPVYLYRNKDELQGTLSRLPERDEVPLPVTVEERLIVEYYS
ncbi:MAG: 30S ribosomal protein S4 [Actinomycetota bacterium]